MNSRWAGLAAGIAMALLCACGPSPIPVASATPRFISATVTATGLTTSTALPVLLLTATASQTPVASRSPTPSPTPGLVLRQLTSGGCCVQPFWSADGSQVRYLDRPSSGQPGGIWGVSLSGGPPSLVTARLGIYSADESLVAYPESGQTYVEHLGSERWKVDNGGRAVRFSPDSTEIAWQVSSSQFSFDNRRVQIWVAATNGDGARQVASLVGGGLAGWFPDSRRLLVTSMDAGVTLVQSLSITDGQLALIARGPRIQGVSLSPLGNWVVYAIAFSGDTNLDGLWVARADGGAARHLPTFGAFAWRAEGILLIIPLDPGASSNRLIEAIAATGAQRALNDPAITPFRIAGGNWALSPDGQRLAFVSVADHDIWVMDLPG